MVWNQLLSRDVSETLGIFFQYAAAERRHVQHFLYSVTDVKFIY